MFWGAGIIVSLSGCVTEDDIKIFKNRYDPQVVLINRLLITSHKTGDHCVDELGAYGKPNWVTIKGDPNLSWAGYMKRSLSKQDYDAWQDDMGWRYNCWNHLENVINPERYQFQRVTVMSSLNSLYNLLGPERFYAGWMPPPIPDYGDKIKWLQALWTKELGFQGRLNNLNKVSPIGLD